MGEGRAHGQSASAGVAAAWPLEASGEALLDAQGGASVGSFRGGVMVRMVTTFGDLA